MRMLLMYYKLEALVENYSELFGKHAFYFSNYSARLVYR
jgi:hypothetical protein